MTGSTQAAGTARGGAAAEVAPGDTVLALFEVTGGPDAGAKRARPALVLEAEKRESIDGRRETIALTVADSRAGNLDRTYPGEFVLSGDASLKAAGLRAARKFDTAKPRRLTFDRDNFILGASGTPRIGRLSEPDIEQARAAFGRAHNKFRNLPEMPGMLPPPPRPGDLVYMFSPFHDAPDQPGAKPRPCLVTAVRRVADRSGRSRVMVTYAPGTSQKLYQKRAGEVRIEDPDRLAELGLMKEGKFKLGDEKTVPWHQDYICHNRPGPHIGRLNTAEIAAVKAARQQVRDGASAPAAPARRGRASERMSAAESR